MELWRVALDWMLILLSSFYLCVIYNRLIMKPQVSIANYVYLILWAFCCLPILLDYAIGRPSYQTVYWYKPFITPMANDYVSAIYDLLLIAACTSLFFYSNYYQKKKIKVQKKWGGAIFDNKVVMYLFTISPYIYILLSGNVSSYLTYGDSVSRGVASSGVSMIVAELLLLSVISFCSLFFRQDRLGTVANLVLIVCYSIVTGWISGKRFMLAILIVLYLFFYLRRNPALEQRKKLRVFFPLALCALLFFSSFYLIVVRPLRDTGFNSVYEMLRVDFGRDDVTKYVIYHEFFLGDHILDYYGQSFLSTLFIWVPRSIWPSKPYQDYQYLTSSILGLPISELPAGTTPCWFEMCIINFSYFGLLLSCVLIVALCHLTDCVKSASTEAMLFVVILALLTQSIDVYLVFVFLIVLQKVISFVMPTNNTRLRSGYGHKDCSTACVQ